MVLSTSAAIPHTFKNWFPLQCSSWDRSMEMQAVNQCRFPSSKWVKVSQAHAKCFSLIQEMSFLKILKQLSLLEIATRHRELTAGMLFKNTPPPFPWCFREFPHTIWCTQDTNLILCIYYFLWIYARVSLYKCLCLYLTYRTSPNNLVLNIIK